jgi:hypothetical protein
LDATEGVISFEKERKDFTGDGRQEQDFASSVIPTSVEKAIANGHSPISQADRPLSPIGVSKKSGSLPENGEASHLSSRHSSKTWTLPHPTPHVDAYDFEDPMSEHFWKNVWVACAVHNVGGSPFLSVGKYGSLILLSD